jgi:protein tyrosine phosphatase (PTP) superfamily phosphohydrolase (DUF442 family)
MASKLLALLAVLAATANAADRPGNFMQWREGLASAAQPDSAWLSRVKDLHYDVVVNLAPPQVHGSIVNEGGIVAAKGVTYVNIPVDFMRPTAEDFRFFSEVMKANARRNVFVHCQVNLRGSSFVFLYRVIHEGVAVNEALDKLYGVWSPDPVWKKFIEETLEKNGKRAELM